MGTRFAAGRRVEILLVEDTRADAELLKAALRECRSEAHLNVVEDGEEALSYVLRAGRHAGASRPNLIILVLHLPKKSGVEVLAILKPDPGLRQIPVVVLTTSDSNEDVANAYHLHANCYVTKPLDVSEYFSKIRALEEFWITAVRLPADPQSI